MNRTKYKRRTPVWSLARVAMACRSAPAIWLAMQLVSDERGNRVLTPTRAHLSAWSGISDLDTISAALTTLEQAGWISREHVPVFEGTQRVATLLRIVLRKPGKIRHTETSAVDREKPGKGRPDKTRSCHTSHSREKPGKGKPDKTGQDSSIEERAHDAASAESGSAVRPAVRRDVEVEGESVSVWME